MLRPVETRKGTILTDNPTDMTAQAQRCRRLARSCGDQQTSDGLNQLADDYDRRAAKQEGDDARAKWRGQTG